MRRRPCPPSPPDPALIAPDHQAGLLDRLVGDGRPSSPPSRWSSSSCWAATSSCGPRRRTGRSAASSHPSCGCRCRSASCCGAAAFPIFYAEAAIRRGSQRGLRAGLAISGLMGLAFLGYTAKDFHDLTFGWRDNAYGSIFYTHRRAARPPRRDRAVHERAGPDQGVAGQVHRQPAHHRRGVQPVLAFRRRRVDLRVRLAVPLRGAPMTAVAGRGASSRRRRCAGASRCGTPPSVGSGRGSSTWCSWSAAEHWTHTHHQWSWTLHACTVVTALATIVALLLAWRLVQSGHGAATTSGNDDAGQLLFLGRLGLAGRRHQPGPDPAGRRLCRSSFRTAEPAKGPG